MSAAGRRLGAVHPPASSALPDRIDRRTQCSFIWYLCRGSHLGTLAPRQFRVRGHPPRRPVYLPAAKGVGQVHRAVDGRGALGLEARVFCACGCYTYVCVRCYRQNAVSAGSRFPGRAGRVLPADMRPLPPASGGTCYHRAAHRGESRSRLSVRRSVCRRGFQICVWHSERASIASGHPPRSIRRALIRTSFAKRRRRWAPAAPPSLAGPGPPAQRGAAPFSTAGVRATRTTLRRWRPASRLPLIFADIGGGRRLEAAHGGFSRPCLGPHETHQVHLFSRSCSHTPAACRGIAFIAPMPARGVMHRIYQSSQPIISLLFVHPHGCKVALQANLYQYKRPQD